MSEILNQKHMASKATSQVEDFLGTELKNIQHYFEELKWDFPKQFAYYATVQGSGL